jgi:hypothetical protein
MEIASLPTGGIRLLGAGACIRPRAAEPTCLADWPGATFAGILPVGLVMIVTLVRFGSG